MAIEYVASYTGQNKVAGTDTLFANNVDYVPGDTLFAFVTFDNLTVTTPVVNIISVPAGQGPWVQVASFNSFSGTAGNALRGELWRNDVTVSTVASVNPVLSASVTAKAIIVLRFTGVGAVRVSFPTIGAGLVAGTSQVDDYYMHFSANEGAATIPTTSNLSSMGIFSTGSIATSGGSAVTNAAAAYRVGTVVTLSTSVTFGPGSGAADGGQIPLFVLPAPPPEPVTHQVSGSVPIASDAVGEIFRTHLITAVAWNYAALGV